MSKLDKTSPQIPYFSKDPKIGRLHEDLPESDV